MFESKYSKVLTVILVIVIISILGLLGFLAYDFIQKYTVNKDASGYVENFQGDVGDTTDITPSSTDGNTTDSGEDPLSKFTNTAQTSSTTNTKPMYKGFGVVGTMTIPEIDFEYPILEKATKNSIETAVAFLYGTGINQPGNSVIVGHNYRNGLFFSNIHKLENGDKIYIKDNAGNTLTYDVYDKFTTSPDDTLFYQRDTGGVPEVTLSTCTDDSKERTIILARAEQEEQQ